MYLLKISQSVVVKMRREWRLAVNEILRYRKFWKGLFLKIDFGYSARFMLFRYLKKIKNLWKLQTAAFIPPKAQIHIVHHQEVGWSHLREMLAVSFTFVFFFLQWIHAITYFLQLSGGIMNRSSKWRMTLIIVSGLVASNVHYKYCVYM